MGSRNNHTKRASQKKLTPELVKAISERVYALLLADLRLESERAGRSTTNRQPGDRRRGV
jgi:hypothetical protein